MACCFSRSNKISGIDDDENSFKIVPKSKDNITAIWCEQALQNGGTTSKETMVTDLEIQDLGNDALEGDNVEDGGGLSGATIVKLIPIYG